MKKILTLLLVIAVLLTGCGIIKSQLPIKNLLDTAKDLTIGKKEATVEIQASPDEDFNQDFWEDSVYEDSGNAQVEAIRKSLVAGFNKVNTTGETPCQAQWNQVKNLSIRCKVDGYDRLLLSMLYPTMAYTATLGVTALVSVSELNKELPEDFAVTVMLTVKGKPVYTTRTSLELLENIADGDMSLDAWQKEAEITK